MSENRTQCVDCEDGTWSSASATECDQCQDGTVPTSNNSDCVECRAVSFRRGMWSIVIVEEIETLIMELTTRPTAELLMHD